MIVTLLATESRVHYHQSHISVHLSNNLFMTRFSSQLHRKSSFANLAFPRRPEKLSRVLWSLQNPFSHEARELRCNRQNAGNIISRCSKESQESLRKFALAKIHDRARASYFFARKSDHSSSTDGSNENGETRPNACNVAVFPTENSQRGKFR